MSIIPNSKCPKCGRELVIRRKLDPAPGTPQVFTACISDACNYRTRTTPEQQAAAAAAIAEAVKDQTW